MTYETLSYVLDAGVATVTLNRPEKLNTLTSTMIGELLEVIDRVDRTDEVRAVILTGAGRAFCAGADLSAGAAAFDFDDAANEMRRSASPVRTDGSIDWGHESVRDDGGRITLRLFHCLKPVIAAVNGPAVGIGATLLLPADIRLASAGARFGFVFTRRGIVPEAASSWFLPRVVGVNRALEWCLSGRLVDAEEALAAGLVSRIVEPADLLPAARALAGEIAENTAPVSVALTRQMLWRMLGADDPMEAHKIDSRAVYALGRSADAKEGVLSFMEKRPARFCGRVSTDLPNFFPWWDARPYA